MKKDSIKYHLKKNLEKNILNRSIIFDYDIGSHTWFGVGGKADVFFTPKSIDELKKVMSILPKNTTVNKLGLGSNVLIRDGGLDGVTIKLGKDFKNIKIIGNQLNVGSAVLDKVLSKFCLKNSISGYEFFYGIPGNIGGAVSMNAGCYGGVVSDIFISAQGIDLKGNDVFFKQNKNNFSYRKNNFIKNNIITNIFFEIKYGKNSEIKKKMENIQRSRIESQPQKVRTGGSTFKNPDLSNSELKAWQLIKSIGKIESNIDGVDISEKHNNFLVNKQKISANRIEEFGEIIRNKVYEKTGILLEWEIQIMGRHSDKEI